MVFLIIIILCNLAILAAMYYSNVQYGKVIECRILDVTFTEEQLQDSEIQRIANEFHKKNKIYMVVGCLSQVLPLAVNATGYTSLFMIVYVLWIVGIIYWGMHLDLIMHRRLYQYKLSKGYVAGESGNHRKVDLSVSKDCDKMPLSKGWFIPVFLSGVLILNVPAARKMINEDVVAMILLVVPYLSKGIYFGIYELLIKKKNAVYTIDEAVNYKCNQLTKYYFSVAIIVAAYVDAAMMLILQYSYVMEETLNTKQIVLLMIAEFVATAVIIFMDLYIRKKREKILRENNSKTESIVDDDYYWAKGWYDNPGDESLFVADRNNSTNFTLNFARPAARVITWGSVILFSGLTIFLCIMFLKMDFQTFQMEIYENEIVIDAPVYSSTIQREDITKVEILEELPKDNYKRRNGAETDFYSLGKYKGNQDEKIYMYYYKGYTPILKIQTEDCTYYFNSKEAGLVEKKFSLIDNAKN